jgi:UDP-N-acetylglucosamine pyrophosphorylase
MAAPNGNGAVFQELRDSGALADMRRRGVKYVGMHSIDNALAKPVNLLSVGALMFEEADAAIKVIRKLPGEKIETFSVGTERPSLVSILRSPWRGRGL